MEAEKQKTDADVDPSIGSHGSQQSLRQVCYLWLLRAGASKAGRSVTCLYKADELSLHAGVDGRIFSGMSKVAKEESLPDLHASDYNCTRAAFTYRKPIKELLRGGKESEDIARDYDISVVLSLIATHGHTL